MMPLLAKVNNHETTVIVSEVGVFSTSHKHTDNFAIAEYIPLWT